MLKLSVTKTVGHRWRNHKRRQKPLVLRIMVEQGRTRILFLLGLTSRCEQIFPHRCCFQPVRRIRQRCPVDLLTGLEDGIDAEVVPMGSWTGPLRRFQNSEPTLWNHGQDCPAGRFTWAGSIGTAAQGCWTFALPQIVRELRRWGLYYSPSHIALHPPRLSQRL